MSDLRPTLRRSSVRERLLQPVATAVKAVVVGNGRVPQAGALPPGALEGADVVIAADGGARAARALGITPTLIVGDGDSMDGADLTKLGELGIPFRRVPAEKDETDLELALRDAVARGATEIVIVAALDGERIEHTVCNLLLLAHRDLAAVDARIVDDRSTIRLLAAAPATAGPHASVDIAGQPGDFVSLLPWGGDAEGVTTSGLRYPLVDEPLPVGVGRGVSNELTGPTCTVSLRSGRLLVIHTRRKTHGPEAPDALG